MGNLDQANDDSAARMRPICARCGSEAIVRDASAVWSVAGQCWELAGTYDSTACQDCGAVSDDVADWRPLDAEMPLAAALTSIPRAMIFHPGTGTLLDPDHAVLVRLEEGDADDAEQVAADLHARGRSVPLTPLLRDVSIAPSERSDDPRERGGGRRV